MEQESLWKLMKERGVNYRAVETLFKMIEEHEQISADGIKYDVSMSIVEIYQENLRDLLVPADEAIKLEIIEHPRTGFILVHGKD